MKIYNPNTLNYVGIDFETTGLPNGVHFRQIQGKINILNPFDKDNPFRDISTTQFGVWDSSSGVVSHFNIELQGTKKHSRYVKGSDHKRIIKDPVSGKNVTLDAYKIRPTTEKDILDLVSKSNIKGKKAEALAQPHINKALGTTDTMYIYKGQHVSKFTLDAIMSQGNIKEKLAKDYPTMNFGELSKREWAGKGKGSLYEHVDNWLKRASKERPLVFGGWNPFFDMNKMLNELVQFGHEDMAKRLFDSYKMGTIEIDAIENYWKAIVFRLAKEDPMFAEHFKIATHAEAAFATGRPGRTFRTFEEFDKAVLHSADFVGGVLKKHFGIQTNQLHSAGPDIHNEARVIKQALFNIAQEAGIDFNLMTEVDAAGNLRHALGNDSLTAKLEAKYGKDFLRSLKKDISSAQDFSALKTKIPSMFESIGAAKNTANALSKFGTLGLALGLATFITYGKGEDSIFPFSSKTKFGAMKKNAPTYKSFMEEDPNYSAQALQTLGYGLLGPAAALYSIGMYTSKTGPEKLGFVPKLPKNLKEVPKHIGDNIYKGIVNLESKFALTRVYGLSNSIDFFRGTFQHSKVNQVTGESRAFSFYNIRNSSVRGMNSRGAQSGHGVQLGNILDEAKAHLTEEQFGILNEKIAPTTVPEKTSSRQVIVKNVNNRTMIVVSDLDENGVEIAAKYTQELPVKLKINKLRGDNQLNRIEWAKQQSDLVRRGISKRSVFEDWYKTLDAPEFIKSTPQWEPLYRQIQKVKHKLDLLPKGIGEGRNSIYPDQPKNLSGTKYGMHVVGYEGQPLKTAWAKANYLARIPRNIFIEKMNLFFESPLELIGVPTNTVDNIASGLSGSRNFGKAMLGKMLSTMARPHLGLPSYDMRLGFPEYMMKIATKRVLPAYAAWKAFDLTDHLLGKLTFSPTGRGPLTEIPIKAFETASLLYSKISDITGFTRIAKAQERVAPGSTGLGIFAPAASAVSTYIAAKMFYEKGPKAIRENINRIGNQLAKRPFIQNAMKEEAWKGALQKSPLERMMSYAIKNPKKGLFALFMAPMLPFFPGFIGSNKSYEERKAEYQGKKEVAIRKYRGWLMSPSPYAGGKPIQFRRHFLNLFESDYQNRGVVWPSFGAKALHDLTLGFANRYALEEYHKDSQPVYESAPYGANIPFVGPLIAASIGRIIKPTVTYHKLGDVGLNIGIGPSYATQPISNFIIPPSSQETQVAGMVGASSEGSNRGLMNRWSRQFHDMIGFTGFSYETIKTALTGKRTPDEFTPYAQSALEMYNPAQQMWGWHAGDITGVGGEFLRRIFPYPIKNWQVNNIPNELDGVSWIPQSDGREDEIHPFKKLQRNLTHGTTFDKTPLGWLYASRKGWEFLYPEVKGKELEEYPDPVRLEVLKSIAPYSNEFRQTARNVREQALSNNLTPEKEQQYYETLNQVRQLKEQLYATEGEFTTALDTQQISGEVESVEEDGSFYLQGNKRKFRLAGISLQNDDIRNRLLQTRKFNSSEEVEVAMMEIKHRTMSIINSRLAAGMRITIETPEIDNISGSKDGTEAIVGSLNEALNEAGAPFANTGNLAEHNMQQDKVGPIGTGLAKYWEGLTDKENFWNRKLIANRDYMHNYLQTQVFNREVKLWNKPVEHFIKPMVASILHRGFLGLSIDKIPSFTVNRRKKQEYWDILRYVKYKSLAVRAAKAGNEEEASYYHNLWRSTMIGANAVSDNTRDIIAALPQNERPYFQKFATEPDPKKRAEIYKYLPRAAKRIYKAIWQKQIAEASDDPEDKAILQNLEETEGWGMTESEEKQWMSETGGNASKADWIRAKYIQEFLKSNPMPKGDWMGWSPDVNEENVELLALRDQGEQIEDFGFFENKARVAAYDQVAYEAAMQINSTSYSSKSMINDVMSTIIQNDNVSNIASMPSATNHPVINIEVDNREKHHRENQSRWIRYAEVLEDAFRFI